MTSTTPENELPFTEYFHEWRKLGVVKAAFPAYVKADQEHDVVREKLRETESDIQYKTQYSTKHDSALGMLNEIKLGFECGSEFGKKERKFASKYFGIWNLEEDLYENLESSLEVLRAAKRAIFREVIELEDQLPKLRAEEERLRKLWIMESDKIKPVWEKMEEEHKAAEEKERQQEIQDAFEEGASTEEAAE